MICPSCSAPNEDAAETCLTCDYAFSTRVKPGTAIASRYEIQRPLGRGGMGTVFEAVDRTLDERVAMKILHPEIAQSPQMVRRFRSEIKLARKVTHKNVCRIHDHGKDRGLHFISMELVEGVDLKRLLQQRGRLPTDEAYDVALQIANGLEAIHEAGIVHRDLKTPNIIRDPKGIVRLMDFGIAKSFEPETTAATATGHVVGTPEYMSPEQAQGRKVDLRSDIYALGIVIFEIFTGRSRSAANHPSQRSSSKCTSSHRSVTPSPQGSCPGPRAPEGPRQRSGGPLRHGARDAGGAPRCAGGVLRCAIGGGRCNGGHGRADGAH